MQKILRGKILEHLTKNNLLSKEQHGFRPGKSCVTQLLETLEDWIGYMDEGNNVDVVYLDFSKAFDKVSHRLLIYKLHSYGIREKVLNWIKEYLESLGTMRSC